MFSGLCRCVSPTEVEEVLYSSGLVKEAAAIGVAHESLGQVIVVVLCLTEPEHYDEAVLMKHCQAQLPHFMLPAKIVILHSLPKNPNGKIDRKILLTQLTPLL